MASRWRIRHKLLLGLGLVVAIMALLLSGTLLGLWSYYSTTNTIRAKLAELEAANTFNAAVTELAWEAQGDELLKAPSELQDPVEKVRAQLKVYSERLQETLDQGRDPAMGLYERDMIQQLEKDLTTFKDTFVEEVSKANLGANKTDAQKKEAIRCFLTHRGSPMIRLKTNAQDLRNHIQEEMNRRLGDARRHYQVPLWIIVPSSVVGVLLMAGLMWSFYAWVLNPIRGLEAGVAKLAKGEFTHRIELQSGDEMEDLAVAFNEMTQRLQDLYADLARQVNERSRQLVRSERLASVGFLAAGVAHEINNPLASINFCSEALEARLGELLRVLRATGRGSDEVEIFRKYLKMIQEEAFRCKNITERLLAFSRSSERKREPTDLAELVRSVLDVTQTLQPHRGKRVALDVSERLGVGPLIAWVNADEIKQVVLNLVINALESMDEGGTLTVQLGVRGGMATLDFCDTGCGMTHDVLENIFEPFFTRSRTGKGTGLGLTISHRIISQHGGEIEATSAGPGQGSTFSVRLPLQPRDALPPGVEVGPRLAA